MCRPNNTVDTVDSVLRHRPLHRSDSPTSVASVPGRVDGGEKATGAAPRSARVKKVLICSENVPPQVNGIARRIGRYADGLEKHGVQVDLLGPDSPNTLSFVNAWNFTARMIVVHPLQLFKILCTPYDVVHVVMPANLSAMWILACFKLVRCVKRESKPTLVVSWHCNIMDYFQHFSMGPLRFLAYGCFFLLFAMLPHISDRVLTPTKKSEPQLVSLWKRSDSRAGVCLTGVDKTEFSPDAMNTDWGEKWQAAKRRYLEEEKKKHLIVCVGRLSPEKGVEELVRVLKLVPDCALWLVGDGPFRPKLEALVHKLGVSVQFLGYQSGEALHAVYTAADLFVCPSLTETFGQTVNEALASRVRTALPRCPVFEEAYGLAIPQDAFWEPLSQSSMAKAIKTQLARHSRKDSVGLPDLDKLNSWDDACQLLLGEYEQSFNDRQHTFTLFAWVYYPIWCAFTLLTIGSMFVYSQIRAFCGGSVRIFVKRAVVTKVQSFQNLCNIQTQ